MNQPKITCPHCGGDAIVMDGWWICRNWKPIEDLLAAIWAKRAAEVSA